MNEQYVIFGETLDATADAIRFMTHKTDLLNPLDFPEEILDIDLTTEEYMRISDLLEYPVTPNEAWYTEEEIAKVDALLEHFENLGPEPTPPTPTNYVENTQDRCIETGVIMEEGSTYKIEIQFASTDPDVGGDERHVFSAYDGGDTFRLSIAYYDDPKYWTCFGSCNIEGDPVITDEIKTATCEYTSPKDFDVLSPITLFSQSEQDEHPYPRRYFVGKVYYCKIWKNDVLIRDLIPEGDGFRDQVNDEYYTWYNGGDADGE